MANIFSSIREKFGKAEEPMKEEQVEEYVELDHHDNNEGAGDGNVIVRPFTLEDFEDVKPILDVLREGNTIALVNIRPLKEKDMIEVKRAINKLKKTTDAISGEIAGFGDDWIVIAPPFASIYRSKGMGDFGDE